MSLITCTECSKKISSNAYACPHCGNPTKEQIITIQQTSKRWKKVKLYSSLGLVAGLLMFGSNMSNGGFENPYSGLGLLIAFSSFVALMVGRFGAWWTNR